MQRLNSLFLLVLLLIFSSGCYTLKQVGTPTDVEIEVTNSESFTPAGHFTRTKTVNHFIFGLVSPDDAGIEKIIADAVKQDGGTAAINVRMKYQQTFINGLVSVITGGIYTPFTLKIEGDVVK